MDQDIQLLGFKMKDRITGFEGVVSSVCFDLYGCIQACLTPVVEKDKELRSYWFDTKRLEKTSQDRVMELPNFAQFYPVQTTRSRETNGPADKPLPHSLTR